MWVTDMRHPPESKRWPCYVRGCTRPDAVPYMGVAEPGLPTQGQLVCKLHHPRRCTYCGHAIPWYDGSVCDWCDRYTDEDG